MGVDLNPNIHLLMDRNQQKTFAGKIPDQVLDNAVAQKGHELVLEDKTGKLSSIKVEDYLANPKQYKSDKPAYLSLDAGGRTVMVSVAVLNKENLLSALGKALSEVESSRIQGVATGEFQQRLIALAAQVRGAKAPTDLPIENLASKSFTVTAVDGGPMSIRKDDKESCSWLQTAIKDADAKVQQRDLEPEARKSAVINELADHFECMQTLTPDQRKALTSFLARFDLKDLDRVSFQGVEGEAKALGLTGSGKEGHYTNSILTSLRQMALTGRLTTDTLAALDKLSTQPLHPKLESQRLDLIRCALQDVAYPACINQHAKGTCAATALQIKFVIAEPARYLQLLGDIASPAGRVRPELLRAPGRLERKNDTLLDDKSGRSVSGRLMQPALMEYANGALTYNNRADKHSSGYGGLFSPQTSRLAQGLFGDANYEQVDIPAKGPERQKAIDRITDTLAHGETVPIGMSWGGGGHEITLTAFDKDANLAYFINPWGATQTMPLDDLLNRVDSALLPKTKPTGKQPALYGLPAPANLPSNYQPIETEQFRTFKEELNYYPELKALPEDRKKMVLHALKDLELPRSICAVLVRAIKGGHTELVFAALAKAKTAEQANLAIGIPSLCQKGINSGHFTKAQSQAFLAAEPLKHLNYDELKVWAANMQKLCAGTPMPDIDDFTMLAQARQADCKAIEQHAKGLKLPEADLKKAMHALQWSEFGPDLIERLKSAPDKQSMQRLILLSERLEKGAKAGKLGDANALKAILNHPGIETLPAAQFDAMLKAIKDGQAAPLKAFGYLPPAAPQPASP